MRRSPRPLSKFGDRNPRSQRCSTQPRRKFGDGGTRLKRRPPRPWQGSLSFTRRFPQPRSKKIAAPARRSTQRACSPLPFHDHVVAVGLRCGKANTKKPRSFSWLDLAFLRDCSARYIRLPIKEESTKLATSFLFSKRKNEEGPSLVGFLLPPTRPCLQKLLQILHALVRLRPP